MDGCDCLDGFKSMHKYEQTDAMLLRKLTTLREKINNGTLNPL